MIQFVVGALFGAVIATLIIGLVVIAHDDEER